MFEYKIQEAWEDYRKDFGLGRIVLFISFYNIFFFFLGWFAYGHFRIITLLPFTVAQIFYYFRPQIVKLSSVWLLIMVAIPLALTTILNYYMVGMFDEMVGGFTRVDPFFWNFDLWLYGEPIADIFLNVTKKLLGSFQFLFYDLIMTSYIWYFFVPFYGGVVYFLYLPEEKRYKLGPYYFSMTLYFALNYILYMAVPVTGPQYAMKDFFIEPLPLSAYGQFLAGLIRTGQGTFIDCFPSGHFGINLLLNVWMWKIKSPHRVLTTMNMVLTVFATFAMRYHYTLDLLASIPMVYICYKGAQWYVPVGHPEIREVIGPRAQEEDEE